MPAKKIGSRRRHGLKDPIPHMHDRTMTSWFTAHDLSSYVWPGRMVIQVFSPGGLIPQMRFAAGDILSGRISHLFLRQRSYWQALETSDMWRVMCT